MPSGETAGPSRLQCKYQNCTNPSCPFRHEDAQGNSIPPPALTAAKLAREQEAQRQASQTSDNDGEDGDVEVVMNSKGLMDGALDDSRPTVQCRYAERCTRRECLRDTLHSQLTNSRLQVCPPALETAAQEQVQGSICQAERRGSCQWRRRRYGLCQQEVWRGGGRSGGGTQAQRRGGELRFGWSVL